jgi:hypothetical protein
VAAPPGVERPEPTETKGSCGSRLVLRSDYEAATRNRTLKVLPVAAMRFGTSRKRSAPIIQLPGKPQEHDCVATPLRDQSHRLTSLRGGAR